MVREREAHFKPFQWKVLASVAETPLTQDGLSNVREIWGILLDNLGLGILP